MNGNRWAQKNRWVESTDGIGREDRVARAQRKLGDALSLLDQEDLLLPRALRVCTSQNRKAD